MVNDKKNVHILVPRGFQNKELLRPDSSNPESLTPHHGECLKCRGTGAIIENLWLDDVEIKNGYIIKCTPKMGFSKCKCSTGQFWVKFHPVNVQAIVFPKFEKEIREMVEREKVKWLTESGGNYEPGRDTFLKDLGYVPPHKQKPKIASIASLGGFLE